MSVMQTLQSGTSRFWRMLGIGSDSAMIGANFRMYGPEMGIYDYEDYLRYARRIYKEAMANPEGFTIIELSEGKKAIDFQGKLRGVFTASGEPVAFFKPDYKKMGFTNYKDELEEFAASIRIAQS